MILNFKKFIFEMAFSKGELDNSNNYLKQKISDGIEKINKDFKTAEIDNEERIFDLLKDNLEKGSFYFKQYSFGSYEKYKLLLKNEKEQKEYDSLVHYSEPSFYTGDICYPIYLYRNFDYSIEVPSIPHQLRGLGFGKKIYKKFLETIGAAFTNKSSSLSAKNLWTSLVYDEDLICFFTDANTLYVLHKDFTKNENFLKPFLRKVLESISYYSISEVKIDKEGIKILKEYKEFFYDSFEDIFSYFENQNIL